MSLKSGLEIRNDDVLQTLFSVTKHQQSDLRGRTLFEAFLESDRMFEEHNYPCTLAVLSEGIPYETKWIEHIKKNKHRYKLELHGGLHINYMRKGDEYTKKELMLAIDKIEATFETRLSMWYPPWGRKGTPWNSGPMICKELGIEMYHQVGKVDAKLWLKNPDKYPHVNFHYWNDAQVKIVNQILCRLQD